MGYSSQKWKKKDTSGDSVGHQDRVVVLNEHFHYSVVGEIKSNKGEKSQNQEQMVGLWQNGQKVMLGLLVDSTQILPPVLALDENEILRLHNVTPLPPSDDDISNSLHHLAKIIVYFNSLSS